MPQGRLNVIDLDFYERVAQRGIPEREIWKFSWRSKAEFDPVWEMVLEGSTGFSGAFARQVTLNQTTASLKETEDLLAALEASARDGGIVLQGEGVFIQAENATPVTLQFDGEAYIAISSDGEQFSRAGLMTRAGEGNFVGTFTGRHGEHADFDHPQPALWTRGPIHAQVGKQAFPVVFGESKTMKISGRHIRENAGVIVNGHRVKAEIRLGENEEIEIELESLPLVGMHFLQVQNPSGLFSNDFIFHVAANEEAASKLRQAAGANRHRRALGTAISQGKIAEVKRLIRDGATLIGRHPDTGSTPLNDAAFHGELEIVRFLIDRGADVSSTSREGTTPLHTAAFFCRADIVKLLLQRGAPIDKKNDRGETPIDIVSGDWDETLTGIYRFFDEAGNLDLDMEAIQRSRPEIVKLLSGHNR